MHCPACGVEQPEGASFCKACGGPMGAPVQQPAPDAARPPAPAPGRGRMPVILGVAGLLALLAVAGVVLLLVLGGGGDVSGVYYSRGGGEPIELKPDGTFVMGEGDFMEIEGTYVVEGNQLTLTMSFFGFETEVEGVIEGGRITIEGDIYEKR